MGKLLLDEHPLQVIPTLATLIGLNESIILQQIHYWLKVKENNKQDYIDGHYWVYNTYEQWRKQFPFWSLMTIRRTITKLENKKLIIVNNYNRAGFDKTKWYTIDYIELDKLLTSVHSEHTLCSHCINGSVQSEQPNTIDYTETTTKTSFKVLKGATPSRSTSIFNWDILKKQIMGSCNRVSTIETKSYIDIIEYYYQTYMDTFCEEHPRLSSTAMDSVVSAIQCGTEMVDGADVEAYHAMIDQHFKTQYQDCDYNICHFMSEDIRNNRFYESCY